jgi:two-component system, NarL family, sensor histidine kinase DesK
MFAAAIAAELASARLLLECDGVAFDYTLDEDGLQTRGLQPEVETALALTLREAVTNVQRHARARRVHARFRVDPGEVLLDIHDDGRGGALAPGNGLRGMRERIEAAGGVLRIDSAPGQGTRVNVRVPLEPGA